MAKGTIKAKEIINYLHNEGFREINTEDKRTRWYKTASEKPSCLKEPVKKKVKS